jgi:hypothetical protein
MATQGVVGCAGLASCRQSKKRLADGGASFAEADGLCHGFESGKMSMLLCMCVSIGCRGISVCLYMDGRKAVWSANMSLIEPWFAIAAREVSE